MSGAHPHSLRPPGILVCGMPRSATTWIFNVISAWLTDASTWERRWIPLDDKEILASYIDRRQPTLGKCHHFDTALASASDIVIYSLRDARSAAVSYRRKFGACDAAIVGGWIQAGDQWRPHASILIRFEDVEKDPLTQALTIRKLLTSKLGAEQIRLAKPETVVEEVENSFQEQQAAPNHAFNATTMITPNHRTYTPPVESLSIPERELYDSVEAFYGTWLHANGYVNDQLGQNIDYEIAAAALAACQPEPVVVDVGAERGSFIDLALTNGASLVSGFEPLPRHIEYLIKRFAGRQEVTVHPTAVSDSSGRADLHIATDRTGRELDFFHTLSAEVGDSVEVVRNGRVLPVETISLSDACQQGSVPKCIDFLKVDTDGHDLSVLKGLGELRPSVIMTEFWQDLPTTSGHNPYTLTDLVEWARAHDYPHHIVIRRRDSLEAVTIDESWAESGDWGNVLFFNLVTWEKFKKNSLSDITRRAFNRIHVQTRSLIGMTEEKEGAILAQMGKQKALDAELQLVRQAADERLELINRLHKRAAEQEKLLNPATSGAKKIAQLETILTERKDLIEKLDALSRSTAERAAVAENIQHSLEKTSAHLQQQSHEAEANAEKYRARLLALEAIAEERATLIETLHNAAQEARGRAAIAEDKLHHLDATITGLHHHLAETSALVAEATSKTEQNAARAHTLEAVAEERAALIHTLDAAARQASERAAVAEDARRYLETSLASLQHQLAESAALITEATAKAEHQTARTQSLEAIAQERAALINALDTTARQACERAAVAEDARIYLEASLATLQHQLAEMATHITEATAQGEHQAARAQALEAIAQERAALINALDATARHASERATIAEHACENLKSALAQQQQQLLCKDSCTDVNANAKDNSGERLIMLEAIAQERAALIDRLDAIARETSERASAAEAVREYLMHEVAEAQKRSATAINEVVDLSAVTESAVARAEMAERECHARQIVIDELVRSRDALLAALSPRPVSWFNRILHR